MHHDAPQLPGRYARSAALALVLIGVTITLPSRSSAQAAASEGPIGRTFELRARDGLAPQLDAGYRRHLGWHAGAGDRWAWYLWEVANGERAGLYVDGTFGHAWADFDAAVDPPGDLADNDLNVEPFAVRGASRVWRRRPELEPTASVVNLEAPLALRSEHHLRPGADSTFAAALARLRGAAGSRPYAVYELVSGGEPSTYVIWIPVATWAEAGAFADRTAPAARALAAASDRVRAELWRFRPDLSICRTQTARCQRALASGSPEAAPGR